MTEQSQYFLESYVPWWLTTDNAYINAYKDRMTALMEMQEYNIDEIGEPFVRETPDCPAVPGMCVFRVEAVVREYDVEVPVDDDGDDDEWTPMTFPVHCWRHQKPLSECKECLAMLKPDIDSPRHVDDDECDCGIAHPAMPELGIKACDQSTAEKLATEIAKGIATRSSTED